MINARLDVVVGALDIGPFIAQQDVATHGPTQDVQLALLEFG